MTGPRAAAIRGLVIIFVHMCRKTLGQQMSRLTKQDEHGLSLLHHAAMNNRPQIIVSLLRQTVDINSRRNNILSTGNNLHNYISNFSAFLLITILKIFFWNLIWLFTYPAFNWCLLIRIFWLVKLWVFLILFLMLLLVHVYLFTMMIKSFF